MLGNGVRPQAHRRRGLGTTTTERKATSFEIRDGLEAEFPFEPYAAQKVLMNKVVEAIETKQHAFLESPTGTGKTLCLLIAALAWKQTS